MNDADRVAAGILRANDAVLAEIGRITVLFSYIEDCLVHDALELARIGGDNELQEAAVSTRLEQLRVMEKRNFLKQVVAEIGRFHGVDHRRVHDILDDFGDIYRRRRSIVHGWIRWSEDRGTIIFVDSHGTSVPVAEVADLNMKVLEWIEQYYAEQRTLMRDVLGAYNSFADRFLQHPRTPPVLRTLLEKLNTDFADS